MVTKSNIMITGILTISLICLVFDTSVLFAEKKDPKFDTSGDCTYSNTRDGSFSTCCWREKVGPGTGPGAYQEVCQTCKWDSATEGFNICDQREIQMLDTPPNPPPSSPSDPSAPIQNDGVLEQPDNPNKDSIMNLPNSNERVLE